MRKSFELTVNDLGIHESTHRRAMTKIKNSVSKDWIFQTILKPGIKIFEY